jgi:HEAT repeat protein
MINYLALPSWFCVLTILHAGVGLCAEVPPEDRIPDLIKKLAADSEAVRVRAEEELARIGPKASGPVAKFLVSKDAPPLPLEILLKDNITVWNGVPGLADKLGDREIRSTRLRFYLTLSQRPTALRMEALRLLVLFNDKDDTVGPSLLELLADEDEKVRGAATIALERWPLPPSPEGPTKLAAALAQKDEAACQAIVKMLKRYGSKNKAAVNEVIKGLDSEDERVRAGCAAALCCFVVEVGVRAGRLGGIKFNEPERADVDWLESVGMRAKELLRKDNNASVRASALYLACWSLDDKAVPLIGACLRKEAPEVRSMGLKMTSWAVFRAPEVLAGVIAVLEDGDDDQRLAAMAALGKWEQKGDSAVPALARLLQSDKPVLRAAAARALGVIGPKASAAVPQLLGHLDDPENEVASAATAALGNVGKGTAVPELIRWLGSDKPSLREAAARALAGIGPRASAAVPQLIGRLDDQEASVAGSAAWALGCIGSSPEACVPALMKALRSRRQGVVSQVADALGSFKEGAKAAVPLLVELAGVGDKQARDSALSALIRIAVSLGPDSDAAAFVVRKLDEGGEEGPGGALLSRLASGDKLALPILIRALEECRPETQVAVICVLGSDRSQKRLLAQALPAVRAAAASEDQRVRTAAAAFLALSGAEPGVAVPILIERLSDKNPTNLANICQLLELFKERAQPALPKLLTLLKHEDGEVRSAAARAIGGIGQGSEATVAAITGLLDDKEDRVRRGALIALGECGKAAKPAIPKILDICEHSRSPEVRPWTWQPLYGCSPLPAYALPAMRRLLKDDDSEARYYAALLLGLMGPAAKDAVGDLAARLATDDAAGVRREIIKALATIDAANAQVIGIALKDKAPEVRASAAATLGELKSTEAIPSLAAALEDGSYEVRSAAAEALSRYGADAKGTVAALERLAEHDPEKSVRQAAAEALQAIHGKPGVPKPQVVPEIF